MKIRHRHTVLTIKTVQALKNGIFKVSKMLEIRPDWLPLGLCFKVPGIPLLQESPSGAGFIGLVRTG